MTARSMSIVSLLANEDIPVMGHLGLVPRKSTWVGGLRAVGKNADEAFITSATQFVMPVIKVDSIKIGNGKVGKYAHIFKDAYMEAIQLK